MSARTRPGRPRAGRRGRRCGCRVRTRHRASRAASPRAPAALAVELELALVDEADHRRIGLLQLRDQLRMARRQLRPRACVPMRCQGRSSMVMAMRRSGRDGARRRRCSDDAGQQAAQQQGADKRKTHRVTLAAATGQSVANRDGCTSQLKRYRDDGIPGMSHMREHDAIVSRLVSLRRRSPAVRVRRRGASAPWRPREAACRTDSPARRRSRCCAAPPGWPRPRRPRPPPTARSDAPGR